MSQHHFPAPSGGVYQRETGKSLRSVIFSSRTTSTMMVIMSIFYLFSTLILVIEGSVVEHISSLNYYELVSPEEINHRITKRHVLTGDILKRNVRMTKFGKYFDIELEPNSKLLAQNFRAYEVDNKGAKSVYTVEHKSFYRGKLRDEPDSLVTAHLDDTSITAHIVTGNDTYYIEPAWRHSIERNHTAMIMYRSSDVKGNVSGSDPSVAALHGSLACGVDDMDNSYKDIGMNEGTEEDRDRLVRVKRSTPSSTSKNTCPLLLVADYRFYNNMGQRSLYHTINYLISLIDRVDVLYRQTTWDAQHYGYGFEIKEIQVFTGAYGINTNHYNKYSSVPWDVRELLKYFSYEDHSSFCLAHLFTYQDFDKGVMGLAYIGTDRRSGVGGICAKMYKVSGVDSYLNSGLTSTLNWGRRILTREADLVTAHEFGHNFGSEHDPESAECNPGSVYGGSYIMSPSAVSGLEQNNERFSPCSMEYIGPTLEVKAELCFEEPQASFCGNYRVESEEQCDAGMVGVRNEDPCCDENCQLKHGAICSDKNSVCCENCTFATTEKQCRSSAGSTCLNDAFCTGDNETCPLATAVDDKTPCIEYGLCEGGECVPLCETNDLISCTCSSESESCYICCRTDADTDCSPYENPNTTQLYIVSDGVPCTDGFCHKGVCEKSVQDLIERIWDVIESISIDNLKEFFSDNIVCAVLICTTLFWVPLSFIVHIVDKRRQKKEDDELLWLNANNKMLYDPKYQNKMTQLPDRTRCLQRNVTPATTTPQVPQRGGDTNLVSPWAFTNRAETAI